LSERLRLKPAHLSVLQQAPIFRGLSEEVLHEAAGYFSLRRYDVDEILFLEGDPAIVYFLLLAGKVKILQTSIDGEQVILHLLGPGDIVGALPTLGSGDYPGSAQAIEPVEAGSIQADRFEELLCDYPRICLNLLRFATAKLQETHKRLREMSTERVERRIARTLSRLAAQIGTQVSEGILVDAPLSRQDLAEMTGTTLYTVSRILKSWERDGIVSTGRRQVVILKPHALAALGEDFPA
jgi:CRP-like cAMP-binding protein